MSRYLMTLRDYNRIYQVADGVLSAVTRSEKACIFFACFGAMVLNKHYKVPAQAVAGGFALCVNDEHQVAVFGERDKDHMLVSTAGFHMWVQTETHVIDFMAPIFPEAFANTDCAFNVPRRMFQRTIASEAEDLNALNSPGDYFTLPDPDLTELLVNRFLHQEMNTDLLMVADRWFGKRRGRQQKTILMGDSASGAHILTLPSTVATGAW